MPKLFSILVHLIITYHMNTIHIYYLCNIGPCTSGTKSSVMEFTIHKFSKELHKCFDKGNVLVCTEFLIDISKDDRKSFPTQMRT